MSDNDKIYVSFKIKNKKKILFSFDDVSMTKDEYKNFIDNHLIPCLDDSKWFINSIDKDFFHQQLKLMEMGS